MTNSKENITRQFILQRRPPFTPCINNKHHRGTKLALITKQTNAENVYCTTCYRKLAKQLPDLPVNRWDPHLQGRKKAMSNRIGQKTDGPAGSQKSRLQPRGVGSNTAPRPNSSQPTTEIDRCKVSHIGIATYTP